MTKDEWIAHELAKADFTAGQQAMMRLHCDAPTIPRFPTESPIARQWPEASPQSRSDLHLSFSGQRETPRCGDSRIPSVDTW
jgi:hypothetical protein